MEYTEKEKAALQKWHGKLHVSTHDLIDIHRQCEKENAEYDEVITYAIKHAFQIRYIDREYIRNYLKTKKWQELHLKQVILIRNDLNLEITQIVSEAMNATLNTYIEFSPKCLGLFIEWENLGRPKNILYVKSEKELLDTYSKACDSVILIKTLVTNFNGPSPVRTCCALGPDIGAKLEKLIENCEIIL